MKTFTASEVKNKTGLFIESVLREPVIIQKSGRDVAIVIPKEQYDLLMSREDAYWASRAMKAEVKGFASKSEITALLNSAK